MITMMAVANSASQSPQMVLANLLAGFDISDVSTMTLTGTRVDELRDKWGSGRKIATSSFGVPYNPIRTASLFGNMGGLTFSSKYLETAAAFSELNWTNGFTVLMLVNKTSRNGYYVSTIVGQMDYLGYSYGERLGLVGYSTGYGVNRNEPCIIGITVRSGVWTYILDGVEYPILGNPPTNPSGAATGKFQIGGRNGASGHAIQDVGAVFIYGQPLSPSNLSQMNSWIKQSYNIADPSPVEWNIVVDGNSLAVGQGAVNVSAVHDGIIAANGTPRNRDYINKSTSGIGTPALIARASTVVDSLYNTSFPENKRILIVWEIGNDIALTSSRTDIEAYNNIKTYCQARKAIGWKVIVGTCIPRTATIPNSNYETYRLSVNTMIRNNAISEGWADAIADVGGDATIGATGASNNTTYYGADKVHLNDAGHTIAKTYFTNAVNQITGL